MNAVASTPDVPSRSTFVTVVAWVFIVLAGMGTVISVLQNVLIFSIMSTPEMQAAHEANVPAGTPAAMRWFMSHPQIFFLAFLVACATTLAAAIGLLKRQPWARWVFVALMGLGIFWNIGGVVLQLSMYSSMMESFPAAPEMPGAPDMSMFFAAMTVVTALFALAFSGVFGWIAHRLLSPPVAAEFRD